MYPLYTLGGPLGTVSQGSPWTLPCHSKTTQRGARNRHRRGNPTYTIVYHSNIQGYGSGRRLQRGRPRGAVVVGGSACVTTDVGGVGSVDGMWGRLAKVYGDEVALMDPHAPSAKREFSFSEVEDLISRCSGGLVELGLAKGERVSFFAENSHRWLIVDQSIMRCGGVSAVRGISSSREELHYILESSQSAALAVQDVETLKKMDLRDENVSRLKFIVVLWGDATVDGLPEHVAAKVKTFDDIVSCSERGSDPFPATSETDLATIVYTSGTTGAPKGVKLTHGNIEYQIDHFSEFVTIAPGERVVSVLPSWHMYQRTSMYYISSCGGCLVFTNIRNMKKDLQKYALDHFVCVPLILDTLYSRILATMTKNVPAIRRLVATFLLHAATEFIKAKRVLNGTDLRYALRRPSFFELVFAAMRVAVLFLPNIMFHMLVAKKIRSALGIRKTVISGGGSLSPYLDDFYEAVGLDIINGYGLSETSPVLTCRSETRDDGNIRGTAGRPIRGTEIRIVDSDTFEDVPDGEKGIILAKGPGIFSGYDNNDRATSDAFYGDYFITGDIGWKIPSSPSTKMAGCIVVQGR